MQPQLLTVVGDLMDVFAAVLTAGSALFVILAIVVILNLLEQSNKDSGYYFHGMNEEEALRLKKSLEIEDSVTEVNNKGYTK